MKYRFNSIFYGIGYIKEMLKEFNLPKIPVITDDIKLYNDALYIKDLHLYRYEAAEDRLVKITDYYYNRPILNLTTNMNLTYSYYSTDFHEYLGNYLRFQRDYKHLNLMPLYNCFSNRIVFPTKNYDENYNYYAIPVKFGQSYTIGFDSSTAVELYCTLWNKTFIKGIQNSKYITPDELTNLETVTKFVVPGCDITHPFIYTKLKDFDASKFIQHFNDLCLIIKMPVSNKTSITVLEGDYIYDTIIDGNVTTEIEHGTKEKQTTTAGKTVNKFFHKTYPTDISLFSVNDEQKHPFADRLMEYLLDEAVTNVDNLDDNIKRVQEYLIYLQHHGPKILYGVWDPTMNTAIYKSAKNTVINGQRYKPLKRLNVYTSKYVDSEGMQPDKLYFDTTKNLIDVYPDLLMYMDKDVEEMFLATGLDDKYTR